MTSEELKLLLQIMEDLLSHFEKNKQSLIAKVIAAFTIKTDKMAKVHVMVMENTLQLKDPLHLRHVFDLKGSTEDRTVKGVIKPSTTLKDCNF